MKRLPTGMILFIFFILVFVFLPGLIHAQPYDACAGLPDPGCDPQDTSPTCICPIDGGLSALIAVGVGYGIKKVRDNRKLSTASENHI
ncbi:MAG: hypothetical protein ABJA32_06990 [Ginsengibacter sp.]